ncbi:hypothetical protein BH23CHL4_BH23CHL4_27980 [soil metagenome]
MVLFQFDNFPDSLSLTLVVGPENSGDRDKFLNRAKLSLNQSEEDFAHIRSRQKVWTRIWSQTWLNASELETFSVATNKDRLLALWRDFQLNDLPTIECAMLAEEAVSDMSLD